MTSARCKRLALRAKLVGALFRFPISLTALRVHSQFGNGASWAFCGEFLLYAVGLFSLQFVFRLERRIGKLSTCLKRGEFRR